MQKHRWIDDSIELDFPLPKSMLHLIAEAEKLDDAEDYAYYNYAEALYDGAKELFTNGKLSRRQWNLIGLKFLGAYYE